MMQSMYLFQHNGVPIPRLGLGTFRSRGEDVKSAVRWALESGYVHFDTASIYKNETEIGQAIKASGVARENVFITSKVSPYEMGYEATLEAVTSILQRLDTAYVDLCLIHWPGAAKLDLRSERHRQLRHESWRALEKLYREQRCKSIGVSNFLISHLEDLFLSCSIKPTVNQVEMHPYLTQVRLREFCQKEDIVVEAYSPLGVGALLEDPTVVEIAAARERTPAQILLRWGLQNDVVVLPKSVKKERIVENADIFSFSLTSEDMASLGGLERGRHFCWSSTGIA